MKIVTRLAILLVVAWLCNPVFAQDQNIVWLAASFEEVRSASPVVGSATIPLPLANAIVAAIPPKYLKEAQEDGFDIPTIQEAVQSMRIGDIFELEVKDYYLKIHKYQQPAAQFQAPRYVQIRMKKVTLPVPIAATNTAVRIIQMAFEDLQISEEALEKVVQQMKRTPPGVLMEGTDRLLDNYIRIRLE